MSRSCAGPYASQRQLIVYAMCPSRVSCVASLLYSRALLSVYLCAIAADRRQGQADQGICLSSPQPDRRVALPRSSFSKSLAPVTLSNINVLMSFALETPPAVPAAVTISSYTSPGLSTLRPDHLRHYGCTFSPAYVRATFGRMYAGWSPTTAHLCPYCSFFPTRA